MIDLDALLADLKDQVRALERDLRERAASEFDATLRAEWRSAHNAERTGAPYESGLKNSWLDDRVTQAAVAWVLGTVFVRFCEDNGLIELPYLAGRVAAEHGARLAVAKERQEEYWNTDEDPTDRGWIERSFAALAVTKATAGLFDRAHNPMWTITPSHEAAKRLLGFWRETKETGEIRHDFTDPTWDTRFLGDLYEHLSTYAQETYALRQTPVFVEEFILRYTLTPALDEFGLTEKFRLVDPTCGSGHFLLSAFEQILTEWKRLDASASHWELIARSLNSVHGVDKNPFAAAIARFRLLIAALKAGGVSHLTDLRGDLAINVAIGDSLLHGSHGPQADEEIPGLFSSPGQADKAHPEGFAYRTEDILDYVRSCDILAANSYDVVVGNPPYIQVKDKQENRNYRKMYPTCSGTYALSVPFAERFFHLARRAGGSDRNGGYVGQITANSFMKSKFGKKLIEEFFSGADPHRSPQLTHVIDTSGVRIPGHGTPTVILIGRNQLPLSHGVIRMAMGIRGEPGQPENPADGNVWKAIVNQVDRPGTESEWISVVDIPRANLLTYPWSLSGGGPASVMNRIRSASGGHLEDFIEMPIGRSIRSGSDEAFIRPRRSTLHLVAESSSLKPIISGLDVRDWIALPKELILYPYSCNLSESKFTRELWPLRTLLAERRTFQGNMEDAGLRWWDYMQHTPSAYQTPTSIIFAYIATHNHFAVDRGGNIFNRPAPVIKLASRKGEEDHLALAGVLNSSTAGFWLRQTMPPKGGSGIGRGVQDETWEERYRIDGDKLRVFPLPQPLPVEFGKELDSLAHRLAALEPSEVCATGVPTRDRLVAARAEHDSLRGQMIALQEELDWEVYRLYGLLDEFEAAALIPETAALPARAFDCEAIGLRLPELKLGERAFEIALARRMARGDVETAWFFRHGSTPMTELPGHWPEAYKTMVEARIEAIERRRDLGLIERPECKRRWSAEPWEKREREALRGWMLDRCEARTLWFAPDGLGGEQPRPITVARLADWLGRDADFVAVARLYGGPDARLADVVAEIVEAEHVPFLAQLRYKPSGLVKWARWEETWEKQREEDRMGQRLDIAVPEKYTSADFLRPSYWRNRGKLDVPKERFISYPYASPETDGSLLLGWAGWDHLQRAQALFTLMEERRSGDGWEADRLAPLLAGLAEVLPWVWQWHGERDAEGRIPAEGYAEYLQEQQRELQLTDDDLRRWPPAGSRKGRASRA
ncbi:BREX-2 system adenine-specific DNA-methyltransferase PglX [Nonomuraea candida]|uniref:BREX-2 system adenine-specific DNA-methyltransferase PglX n=1 Tax=Nonomuraea candida TaxID=359159 RepID=UPI000A90083B|nr:BREX-2 system adenine-specific DNA-methyltransferase PglX [Nonomuraea candida]